MCCQGLRSNRTLGFVPGGATGPQSKLWSRSPPGVLAPGWRGCARATGLDQDRSPCDSTPTPFTARLLPPRREPLEGVAPAVRDHVAWCMHQSACAPSQPSMSKPMPAVDKWSERPPPQPSATHVCEDAIHLPLYGVHVYRPSGRQRRHGTPIDPQVDSVG